MNRIENLCKRVQNLNSAHASLEYVLQMLHFKFQSIVFKRKICMILARADYSFYRHSNFHTLFLSVEKGDALDPKLRKYSSFMDCWSKTLQEGGMAAMYKGYTPSIARAVPVNAAIFTGFTAAQRAMG
jgi:hypothetical protein